MSKWTLTNKRTPKDQISYFLQSPLAECAYTLYRKTSFEEYDAKFHWGDPNGNPAALPVKIRVTKKEWSVNIHASGVWPTQHFFPGDQSLREMFEFIRKDFGKMTLLKLAGVGEEPDIPF